MKWLRRLAITLGILCVLGLIVYEVGRRVLASQYVTEKVAAHLEKAYGAPLQIDHVDVGMSGSSVEDLRLYPAGSDGTRTKPWVVVKNVATDVSLWDAIRGAVMPKQLTLSGASITLHFDREGNLLTKLPRQSGASGPVPEIRISQSELTLEQEGRAPMKLTGISGEVHTEDGSLVLTGDIDDPTWGSWTLHGSWDRQAGTGSADLKSPRVHLTQAKLETIPIVSDAVWQQVNHIEGDARAELHLNVASPSSEPQLTITLEPIQTSVSIASIDLSAVLTAGSVVIEGAQVKLHDLTGKTADGELKVSGNLDFRDDKRTVLQFDVTGKHLELARLPAKWELPRQITGRLEGHAKLQLTIANGQVQTTGEGRAVIKDAKVAGEPAEPIELIVKPAGKGFHFSSPTNLGQDAPALMLLANTCLLADPPTQPTYLEVRLALKNVDLEELARNLGLQLPFAVAGRLSVRVQAGIPTNTPRDLKAYRLAGTASLSWCTVEGLRLENVEARVKYADGVLQLEQLKGQVPSGKEQATATGALDGTARAELFPAGNFTAQLHLQDIPLARVASLVPHAAENVAGVFNGDATVKVPVNQLRDVKTWEADANLRSERLVVYGVQSEALSAQASLRKGKLALSRLTGNIEGGPVTGSAELNLSAPYRYQAKLDLEKVDLGMLQRINPAVRPALTAIGRFWLKTQAQGTLSPFAISTTGEGGAEQLTLSRVTVSNVSFAWEGNNKRLVLSRLKGSLYQGTLTGTATIPLQPAEPGSLDLHFKQLDLSALRASLPPLPVRLDGRADGSIEAKSPPGKRERSWTTSLELSSQELKIQGLPAQAVKGSVVYQQGVAKYQLRGETLGGTFDLDGSVPIAQPAPAPPQPQPKGSGQLRFQGLHLSRFWAYLGLEDTLGPLRGSLDAELNYTHQAGGVPTGKGRWTIRGLNWEDTPIGATELTGGLELKQEQFLLEMETGAFDGNLDLTVAVNLKQSDLGGFELHADNVALDRLLAPWPDWADRLRGQLDADLRGSLGEQWTGSGSLRLREGTVYGMAVRDWRLPAQFSYSAYEQLAQISFRDSVAELLSGWITGDADLSWGSATRLEGKMRFSGVDIRQLFRDSSISNYGSGHLSGQVDFSGDDIHALSDISARINATLEQAQALQFPVLQQLTPFLFGISSLTVFQQGQLRANLDHGVLRIQSLNLQAPILRLFLRGTVTVPDGQLNLGVTVENTTLQLHVIGSYHNPSIQVRPFALFLGE